MKHVIGILIFYLLLSFAASAQTGAISGSIRDAEDQLSLAGASVFIETLQIGTTSNINGEFTLLKVPAGTYTVFVEYMGYASHQQEIVIKSGEAASVDFELTPGIVNGSEIQVLGERLKGQAKALNIQRSNPNITNIVSADQIGRFPDANIGDALKRIPSITVNYDQGEARFANLRGTEPRLSSVMINGERVPSAEGEIRAVQLDLIPSAAIQSIEVNKAVTPDMDADAIGGAINLVTRQAPYGMRVSATAGSGYNFLREEPQTNLALIAGNRYLNNKLGVVINASYFDNNLGSDNAEGEWAEANLASEWDVRRYNLRRLRRSASAAFDYRLNPTSTIKARAIYNHRNDWENRFRLRFRDLDEDVTEIRRQTKGGIGNETNDNSRLEQQITWSTSLSGEHLIGNALKLNWLVSGSKASEERPTERYIEWRARDIAFNADYSNLEEPKFNPASALSFNDFSLREITEEDQYTEEEDFGFKLDLEVPLSSTGKYKNAIKLGGRYKQKDKLRDNIFYEFEPLDEDAFISQGLAASEDLSDPNYEAGDYSIGTFTTPEFLGSLDLDNSSLFEKTLAPSEFIPANYNATEKITAGYAMLQQNIGPQWLIIAGARLEQTDIDYTGNEFNDDTEESSTTNGTDDYVNILPGFHAKYTLNSNSVLRFAWTNTLSRPNYYQLVPYRNILVEDEEIEIGNPALEPTTSMNFDLMAEHYFQSVGIVSGGVFYKDIQGWIYLDEGGVANFGDAEFKALQPKNGGEASLLGIEFAFQRQLTFLPGLLRNLGFYGNYTYTSSSADNPEFQDAAETDDTIDLPGTAPHTLNAALTFQTPRVVLGASFNYTSAYLDPDGLDLTPGLERFYDKVTYLDLNGAYAFTPELRFFFELNNLLNQPLRYYAGSSERTYQAEYYQMKLSFGLKYDL